MSGTPYKQNRSAVHLPSSGWSLKPDSAAIGWWRKHELADCSNQFLNRSVVVFEAVFKLQELYDYLLICG